MAKGHAMPGAADALAALAAIPGVVQSVLTGNVAPNAALKLATFGLDRFINFEAGAYGSDDSDRPALVRLARHAPAMAPRHGRWFTGPAGPRTVG